MIFYLTRIYNRGWRLLFEAPLRPDMSDPSDRAMAGRSVSLIPGIIYEWTTNGTLPVDSRSDTPLPEPLLIPIRPAAGVEIVRGYHLIDRLGDKSTSGVWSASGPGGVLVALKLVEVGHPGRDQTLRSLELMAPVSHPNLSTNFGVWDRGDLTVIGMDLAVGTLLDRYQMSVAQGATGLAFPELITSLLQVASGIDFLNGLRPDEDHCNSVALIHRNIKPANLLLTGGSLKVGDFGMVKPLVNDEEERLTEPEFDEICSLLTAYSSPEVRQGGVSSHSDQFSLAATYCHLRGGYVPATRSEATGPLDLSMLPARERPAVARAMAYQPEDRWPSCVEFVEALQASACKIVRDESQASTQLIALSRMLSTPTSARDRFRRPLAAFSAVAACLAVIVGFLWLNVPFVMDQQTTPSIESTPVIALPSILSPTTAPTKAEQAEPDAQERPLTAPVKNSPESLQALVLAHRATSIRSRKSADPRDRTISAASSTEVWKGVMLASQAVHQRWQTNFDLAWRSGQMLVQAVATMASRPPAPVRILPEPAPEPNYVDFSGTETPLVLKTAALPKSVTGSETFKNSSPKIATIIVRLPNSQAELVVRGEVGSGDPDEWYGPRRVIHSPPLDVSQEYIIGAFWTDPNGLPFTRSKKFQVDPGRLYEVDLRSETPTAVEVNFLPRS